MASKSAPRGLAAGGRALWRAVVAEHSDLDPIQIVQLTEACRLKDRLDKLDLILRGDIDTWARLTHRTLTEDYELVVDDAAKLANATANQLKQLLAALRLPDADGKRPQQRGGGRGSYAPESSTKTATSGGATLSSLDRARAAKSGA